jgi:FxLD family lantipeptide
MGLTGTTQARAPPGTARWPRLFWRRARRENGRSCRPHTKHRKPSLPVTEEVAPQLGRESGNSIPTKGRDMRATLETADTEDIFALDAQVITDVPPNPAAVRCTTNDGCASTCASSCASRG